MEWDWAALKFLLDLGTATGVVGVGVYSWWVGRNHATRSAIDSVGERVSCVEDRVACVERDMRHLPTSAHIADLHDRIATLGGDLREIKGALQGLARAVDLINEHLINQGRRNGV